MPRRSLSWVATAGLFALGTACSSASAPVTSSGTTPAVSTTVVAGGSVVSSSIADETPASSTTTADSGGAEPAGPPARLSDLLAEPIDAVQLAGHLSAATAAVRDESLSDSARVSAGAEMQLALRWLAERPQLDEDVLELLQPPAIRPVRRMIEARRFAAAIRSGKQNPVPPTDQLPAWTIVEAEPMETLLGYYTEAEAATGVAWYWLAAIHVQETRVGRIVGVSSAGAVGPMQFLPSTWQQCCVGDPTVTRDAILGAATYLSQSGAPDDMRAAVYQYNPNVSYVVAVTATAENLREAPELFAGYYGWQVYFASSAGDVRLPVGYTRGEPISATEYLRQHPQDLGD